MRKLATIQTITAIRPIDGADKIEVADVLGWSVVCAKGDFAVGDLVVYMEVDSWLDATDARYATFEARFSNWGEKRGLRVRTIKLRKQISQGLIMPISEFEELSPSVHGTAVVEGEDVTDILKIEKWQPAEDASIGNTGLAGRKVGTFPSFIRKTDQERVQNYINELPKHKDETFEVSIKLDGSSMTLFHVGKSSPHYQHILADQETKALRRASWFKKLLHKLKKFAGGVETPDNFVGVCSRNIQLSEDDDSHFSTFASENFLLEKLKDHGMNIAVQGELVGPTIQQNYEKVDHLDFYVFDVFDIDTQTYLKPRQARAVTADLGMKYVPVLQEASTLSAHEALGAEPRQVVESILNYAEGPGMNKGVKREGCVYKSNESDFSFKVISNSYLLKKEGKA